jgi:hypothetical protein
LVGAFVTVLSSPAKALGQLENAIAATASLKSLFNAHDELLMLGPLTQFAP